LVLIAFLQSQLEIRFREESSRKPIKILHKSHKNNDLRYLRRN